MRIFIGMTEVAGYFSRLAAGFRDAGIPCDFVRLTASDRRGYGGETDPVFLVRWLRRVLGAKPRGRFALVQQVWLTASQVVLTALVLAWAIARYDVFIFAFRGSFFLDSRLLKYRDLPILKLFGKRIIYVFLGSDCRPIYMNAWVARAIGRSDPDQLIATAKEQKSDIQTIEKYADFCVSYPAAAHFFERPIIQFLALGMPFDMKAAPEASPPVSDAEAAIRIVHAPSNPELKGTPLFREIIGDLKSRGFKIDYRELIEMPNAKVLEEMRACDFVLCQAYSDTPLATVGVEGAFFGKPTVIGGLYAKLISSEIPAEFVPPSHFCPVEELPAATERMIVDHDYRRDLGRRAQRFVTERWQSKRVAQRFIELIEGPVPESWWFDPRRVRHLHGIGQTEALAKEMVACVLSLGGPGALRLGDKPELERMVIDFATSAFRTAA